MGKSTKDKVVNRFIHKGVFPYQLAFTLLIPLRKIFLSPNQLLERLNLEDDFNVLEIGPGPGFFSIRIAQHLKRGKLVLADIQEEMLSISKRRIERKGLKNVEYKLLDGQKLDFSDKSFDRVFMVTVLGEVENQEEYIKEIYRILKDGGILSVSELVGDPDKMRTEQLKELVIPFGFKSYKQFGSEKNYTINFVK